MNSSVEIDVDENRERFIVYDGEGYIRTQSHKVAWGIAEEAARRLKRGIVIHGGARALRCKQSGEPPAEHFGIARSGEEQGE